MSPKIKVIAAVSLLAIASGYFAMQLQGTGVPPAEPIPRAQNPVGPPQSFQRGEPPTEEERAELRREFRADLEEHLGLTAEQKAKLQALEQENEGRGNSGDFRERRAAMEEILTPEQREKAREYFVSRIRSRMAERASVLPPEEQQKFMEKLDERIEQRRREGPPGARRGGPGGDNS
jgi:Spy/CpxP family protein refolding chaperone